MTFQQSEIDIVTAGKLNGKLIQDKLLSAKTAAFVTITAAFVTIMAALATVLLTSDRLQPLRLPRSLLSNHLTYKTKN